MTMIQHSYLSTNRDHSNKILIGKKAVATTTVVMTPTSAEGMDPTFQVSGAQ